MCGENDAASNWLVRCELRIVEQTKPGHFTRDSVSRSGDRNALVDQRMQRSLDDKFDCSIPSGDYIANYYRSLINLHISR